MFNPCNKTALLNSCDCGMVAFSILVTWEPIGVRFCAKMQTFTQSDVNDLVMQCGKGDIRAVSKILLRTTQDKHEALVSAWDKSGRWNALHKSAAHGELEI